MRVYRIHARCSAAWRCATCGRMCTRLRPCACAYVGACVGILVLACTLTPHVPANREKMAAGSTRNLDWPNRRSTSALSAQSSASIWMPWMSSGSSTDSMRWISAAVWHPVGPPCSPHHRTRRTWLLSLVNDRELVHTSVATMVTRLPADCSALLSANRCHGDCLRDARSRTNPAVIATAPSTATLVHRMRTATRGASVSLFWPGNAFGIPATLRQGFTCAGLGPCRRRRRRRSGM